MFDRNPHHPDPAVSAAAAVYLRWAGAAPGARLGREALAMLTEMIRAADEARRTEEARR